MCRRGDGPRARIAGVPTEAPVGDGPDPTCPERKGTCEQLAVCVRPVRFTWLTAQLRPFRDRGCRSVASPDRVMDLLLFMLNILKLKEVCAALRSVRPLGGEQGTAALGPPVPCSAVRSGSLAGPL